MSNTQVLLLVWILLIAGWWLLILMVKYYNNKQGISRKSERSISVGLSIISSVCLIFGALLEVKFFIIFAHFILLMLGISVIIRGIDRED